MLQAGLVIKLVPDKKMAGRFALERSAAGKPWTNVDASSGELAGYEDLAMLIHTSGTTSKPKSVPLTHRQLGVCSTCILSTLQVPRRLNHPSSRMTRESGA